MFDFTRHDMAEDLALNNNHSHCSVSGCGLKSQFGDELIIQCNAVHGNRRDGILPNQNSPVLVKNNSITCNSDNGIITDNQGKVRGKT